MLEISKIIFLKEIFFVKKNEKSFKEYYFLEMGYIIGHKTNA
jgi:hypothetical protein